MLGADAVAQLDAVLLAGAAAVAVILSLGEEGAEHAVLHMEHRHVLVDRDLEPFRRGGLEERGDLLGVEVVRDRQAFEGMLAHEPLGGQAVGDVEGEVGAEALALEGAQILVITHQVAVGLAGEDDLADAPFALLVDARAHGPELDLAAGFLLVGADARDGGPELLRVFVFGVDHAGAAREGGLKLLGFADDDDDLGLAGALGLEGGDLGGLFLVRQERPAERLAAELRDLFGEVATKAVQLADRDDEGALEVGLQLAHFEARVAEAAQLVAERGDVHRTLLGRGAGHRGLAGDDVAFAVVEFDAQGLAETADDLGVERAAEVGLLAVPGIMQTLVEFLVLGLPEDRAGLHQRPVDVFAAEADERQAAAGGLESVDEAALFAFGRLALVEDHAVAGLEGAFEAHRHAVGGDVDDRTEVGAALLTEAGVNELLIIDAAEPARVQAARERHLHRIVFFLTDLERGAVGVGALGESVPGGVHRATVGLRDGGNVFGGLQAALDLQGADAGTDQVGHDFDAGEVLRGEEIGLVAEVADHAVDHEFVRQAAGLGAFAAVGRAAAERFARQALAGIGDAEGAVDEDFEVERFALGGLFRLHLLHLRDRDFAAEDGERGAETAGVIDARRARDRHLRRSVDREVGGDPADEAADAGVLDDGGINAGRDDRAEGTRGFGQFVREDQRIEGHVALDPAAVQVSHELRQVGLFEVLGPDAGVEATDAEEHRIGAVLDRRADAVPFAGRGEDFGLTEGGEEAGGGHEDR